MKNPKIVAMDMIAGNPELSKMMSEGMKSGPGSTAQKKARSILQSAFATAQNRYPAQPQGYGQQPIEDGQGGGETFMPSLSDFNNSNSSMMYNPSMLNSSNSNQSFSGLLTLKDPTQFKPGQNMSSSSSSSIFSPGYHFDANGNLVAPQAPAPVIANNNNSKLTIDKNLNPLNTYSNINSTVLSTPKSPVDLGSVGMKFDAQGKLVPQSAGDKFIQSLNLNINKPTTTKTTTPATGATGKTTTPYNPKDNMSMATPPAGGTSGNSSIVTDNSGLSGLNGTGTTGATGSTYTSSTTGTGTPGQYSFLNQLYDSGVGDKAAPVMIMNNPAEWAKILNVPVESLPKSPLLGDQIQELSTSLRQKYNLDNLQNEILTRTRNGANMDNTLNDYMTGRDQYINSINTLMDKAKASFATSDYGDPYIQQTNANYLNFLTTMKGSQEKRYADFVKMSTDMYTQETQALTDNYNIQKELFTNELQNKSVSTQQQYNDMKDVLAGLYDAQDTIIDRSTKLAMLNQKLLKSGGEIGQDIFDSNGNVIGNIGGGTTGNTNAGAYDLTDAVALYNIKDQFTHIPVATGQSNSNGQTIDVNMTAEPIADLMNQAGTSSATEAGRVFNAGAVIGMLNKEIQGNISAGMNLTSSATASNNALISNYQNLISQYYHDNFIDKKTQQPYPSVLKSAGELAYNLATAFGLKVKTALSNPTVMSDVQNAIQDFCYDHHTFTGDQPRTAAQVLNPQFVKDWEARHPSVNGTILNAISNFYKNQSTLTTPTGKSVTSEPRDAFLGTINPVNSAPTYIKPAQLTFGQTSNIIVRGALGLLNFQGLTDAQGNITTQGNMVDNYAATLLNEQSSS